MADPVMKDGGPMAPVMSFDEQGRPKLIYHGITVRQFYFATALQGILSRPAGVDDPPMIQKVEAAWKYAQLMLKQQEK